MYYISYIISWGSRRPQADWKWGVWGGAAPPTGRPQADWKWGVWGNAAPQQRANTDIYGYMYIYIYIYIYTASM